MPLILPGNVGSATAATGYDVANSCRFDDGSSDHMHKTPGSAGSRIKWTFSVWLKRSALGQMPIFAVPGGDTNNYDEFYFNDSNKIQYSAMVSGTQYALRTKRQFRDTTAWMHLALIYDSNNGTAGDRMQLWVNGVRTAEGDMEDTTFKDAQNYSSSINNDKIHYLGKVTTNTAGIFDGYMAEVVFQNNSADSPVDKFGEFDSDSGIFKPIDVSSLTLGTNGFYLDFEASGNLGNDVGGGTDLTEVNMDAQNQSIDTCTNNFATWNNLLGIQIPDTFSESNLVLTMGQNAWRTTFSTIAASSGKFYAEVKWVTGSEFTAGFGNAQSYSVDQDLNDLVADPGGDGYVSVIYKNGALYENGSNTSTGYSTYSSGDIIMLAMDLDNYKLYLGVGGTWGKSGDPAGNSNGVAIPSANQGDFFHFAVSTYGNTQASGNFGSPQFSISSGNTDGNGYGNFEYAVPSGFFSLNSKNLAEFG
tara:strand:+ start:138 stop:1559 length:1422 start_codon:yes stop_codon:yes gene_type:complete